MSKKFELKKCKTCRQELYGLSGLKFVVDGQVCCSDCLEKAKGLSCRQCHKNLSPNHYSDGLGKVNFVFERSRWGGYENIDVSSVCCIDCLNLITEKRGMSNNGGWKECQTPNCSYTLSPNEEAIGKEKCCHCLKKEFDKVQAERKEQEEEEWEIYKQVHEKAQNWWDTLSSSGRERECERLVENMKQGKYWANNVEEGEGSGWACDGGLWMIENGKFTSRSPHLVPIQIAEEFMKSEVGFRDNKKIEGFISQVVRTKKVKKNDDNNPSLEIENKERKNKKIEVINNNKSNNEVLVIELKKIKKITLKSDKLEIEFNSTQNDQNGIQWYSVNQVITNEQVDNSQELKTIRDYLQKTNKDSLNQRELTEIFSSSSVPSEIPNNTNKFLGVGIVILVFGFLVWLLVKSKHKWKKT